MRFLLGLAAVLLVAACSGASSNELFGLDPVGVNGAATEPGPADDPPAAVAQKDARSSSRPVDAGGGGTDAAEGGSKEATKCRLDTECDEGAVCNWQTDVCAVPGVLGDPCKRDLECTDKLCNWKLETCTVPAPSGTECRRNKECASGVCLLDSSTCK